MPSLRVIISFPDTWVTAENDKDAVLCDTANDFSVNIELSVLTMAGAALAHARASKDASTATVAARS